MPRPRVVAGNPSPIRSFMATSTATPHDRDKSLVERCNSRMLMVRDGRLRSLGKGLVLKFRGKVAASNTEYLCRTSRHGRVLETLPCTPVQGICRLAALRVRGRVESQLGMLSTSQLAHFLSSRQRGSRKLLELRSWEEGSETLVGG